MPITHQHLTVIPDDANYDVSADEWNAGHVMTGGTNGDVLVRNTADPSGWSLVASAAGVFSCSAPGTLPTFSPTFSGITVGPGQGGTGITSYAVGDLLVATGTTTLSRFADVAIGAVLASGGVGTVPTWSISPSLRGSLTVGTAPGGHLSVGTNPATTGMIRLNNEVDGTNDGQSPGIWFRNGARTLDRLGMFLDTNDFLWVGNTTVFMASGKLCLGAQTNIGPGLFRNGTGIDVKLADESAFTAINAITAPLATATRQLATTEFVMVNMATAGGGNVVGPASSVDHEVVLYNGTSGKVLTNSTVTITTLVEPVTHPLGATVITVNGDGGAVSTIGSFRLCNNTSFYFRNATNTANVQGLFFASDPPGAVGRNYVTSGCDFVPAVGDTYDVGKPTLPWRHAYFDDATVSGFYDGLANTPGPPAASTGRLYFALSGGKVQLFVRFPTGTPQLLAMEP